MTAPEPMLTTAQLAAHLSVSVRHVERCAAAGMPSILVGARAKRYRADECLAWLAQNSGALSAAPPVRSTPVVSRQAVTDFMAASSRMRLRCKPSER
jgi:hypothetical protein